MRGMKRQPVATWRFFALVFFLFGMGACDGSDDDLSNATDPEIDWIRIEPGTYIFGSPEQETPCRDDVAEKQVTVTLTRAFVMAETEITQAQWKALGFRNPSEVFQREENEIARRRAEGSGFDRRSESKERDQEPVNLINLFEAAAWCNLLSKLEGLDTCYDLSECRGEVGSCSHPVGESCEDEKLTYECEGDIHKYPDYYECPGYRLPATAEWEYAAKAGTTTHTYNGDLSMLDDFGCVSDSVLDEIAWYCANSRERVREVARKRPNPWGFYDMLGNVAEWVDYVADPWDSLPLDEADGHPGEDLVDPVGPATGSAYDTRGYGVSSGGLPYTCMVRASAQYPQQADFRGLDTGFRPVRTL